MDIKEYRTVDEQIRILKERQLFIDDEEAAKKLLEDYNYYRLSGYSLTLRKDDVFYPTIKFSDVVQLYDCDTEMKKVLFSFLEGIELSFRTHIAYVIGAIDPLAHEDPTNYLNGPVFSDSYKYIEQSIKDNRNEAFIKHHKEEYDGHCPIWVVSEVISFGTASKLYSSLSRDIQKEIASKYYKIKPIHLQSSMRNLVVLRNLCAHRARLYNRGLPHMHNFSKTDKNLFGEYGYESSEIGKTLFFSIYLMMKFHPCENVGNHLIDEIEMLFKKYPFVKPIHYGFKSKWKELLSKANN